MAKKDKPPTMVGLTLLHKCNFRCPHCGYLYVGESDDHPIKPGYILTWEQIRTFISDCSGIEGETFSVVINGGEPTLWEEGDLRFIDVVLAIAEGGINPSFNTNGSYFTDYKQCYDFFHRYAEEGKLQLATFVSVDKFHDNYDREKGRALCLDNIKKVLDEMPPEKRAMHRVHVVTIISKDPDSILPKEMWEHYAASGITQGDFPMQPIGRAKELMDEMPDSEEYFKKMPRPPKKGDGNFRAGTLMGEYYRIGDENVARLGHLKEYWASQEANA